jgi:hypothetical protein
LARRQFFFGSSTSVIGKGGGATLFVWLAGGADPGASQVAIFPQFELVFSKGIQQTNLSLGKALATCAYAPICTQE